MHPCGPLSVKLLQAVTNRDESGAAIGGVELSNELHTAPLTKGQSEVAFCKIRPEAITPTSLSTNVLVSSVVRSPLLSLYHSLHQVRMPGRWCWYWCWCWCWC